MSQFQRRFVIASIVYICMYAPAFLLLWGKTWSLPPAESDRLLYLVAPFQILAVISGIAAQVLVLRDVLSRPFSSRWTRNSCLAFVILAPQLGPIAWLVHTAHDSWLSPKTDHR